MGQSARVASPHDNAIAAGADHRDRRRVDLAGRHRGRPVEAREQQPGVLSGLEIKADSICPPELQPWRTNMRMKVPKSTPQSSRCSRPRGEKSEHVNRDSTLRARGDKWETPYREHWANSAALCDPPWNGADLVFSPREGRLGMVVSGRDDIGPARLPPCRERSERRSSSPTRPRRIVL